MSKWWLPVLLSLSLVAGCKGKSGSKDDAKQGKAAATATGPLAFADLEAYLPAELDGLPRKLVTPSSEIGQVSAYYQDETASRFGHVTLMLLEDVAAMKKHYDAKYPQKTTVAGHSAFSRHYVPVKTPETAESCAILADRVSACVDLSPGTAGAALPLLEKLPLAELGRRAAAR